MTIYDEQALAHYGVLGMKWGVRRDRKTSSVKNAKKKTTGKKEPSIARKAMTKLLLSKGAQRNAANFTMYHATGRKITDSILSENSKKNPYKMSTKEAAEEVANILAPTWRAVPASERVKHSDSLAHYGVKGMKWGVRKDRQGDGRVKKSLKTYGKNVKSSLKSNASETGHQIGNTTGTAAKNAILRTATRKKSKEDISKLSDEELKKRVARLNLESQYKNLTQKDVSATLDLVSSYGGIVVGAFATAGATALVNSILKS